MQLRLMTWSQVEHYLKTQRHIIIPIGATEQHGPNGLIGTDHICAEEIAKGIGEATGTLVAPTLNVGMSLHHLDFPGSMSLRPETLIEVVKDWVMSLSRHGFNRFFFINGHGGNIHTLNAAFASVHFANPEVRCTVVNWWVSDEVAALAKELFGDREGYHATPSEVSVTKVFYPVADIGPVDMNVGRDSKVYGPADFRRRYPDGRMASDPSLASKSKGEKLYQCAVRSLGERMKQFVEAP